MFPLNLNIDLLDNSYRLIGQARSAESISISLNAFDFLREMAEQYAPADLLEELKAWFDAETIVESLKRQPTISRDFFSVESGVKIRSTFMIVDTNPDGSPRHILGGFEDFPGGSQCGSVPEVSSMNSSTQMAHPVEQSGIQDEQSWMTQDLAIRQFMDLMLQSGDSDSSLAQLLESVGRYYNAGRAYIFEQDETGQYMVNTYEWCAPGVTPEIDNLQEVPIQVADPWMEEFRKRGSFYISCDDQYAEAEPIVYEVLQPQGITSLMAAPLVHRGKIIGFLGVDNPQEHTEQKLFLTVAASVLNHEILAYREKEKEEEYREALQQSTLAAQAANDAKTSFLFNMSHDIRTPINAIMGFRDLLERHQEEPEKRADYLQKIEEASTALLSILNNVLEMSRIERGSLAVENSPIVVESFVDSVCSMFGEMMEQKGLDFTKNVSIQNPSVYGDETKLREIFCNLLSNAYKYTRPGGSVTMTVEELPSDKEGWTLLQTTVADTGIGMSGEYQKHIFEEFSRENNTTDAKVEGTGLGMSIVRRLVEMLDGKIEIQSEKGAGSSFTVTIPHLIAAAPAADTCKEPVVDQKQFEGKRILLAEDNDLNAEIAMEILKEEGFLVDRAEDGKICVDMLKNSVPGYYDLVLMDIQMPNMNGYDAAKEIRSLEDPELSNIKILAMTANAFEEDRKAALQAGMNGHLAKPMNVPLLMKTLSSLIGS